MQKRLQENDLEIHGISVSFKYMTLRFLMRFLFPATVYVGGAPRFSIPMAGHGARTAQISDGAGDPTKIVISSQHGCSDESWGFRSKKNPGTPVLSTIHHHPLDVGIGSLHWALGEFDIHFQKGARKKGDGMIALHMIFVQKSWVVYFYGTASL